MVFEWRVFRGLLIGIVHVSDDFPNAVGSLPENEDKFTLIGAVRVHAVTANDVGKGPGYLIGDPAQIQISSRSLIGGFDGGFAMDGWFAWAENIAIFFEKRG